MVKAGVWTVVEYMHNNNIGNLYDGIPKTFAEVGICVPHHHLWKDCNTV